MPEAVVQLKCGVKNDPWGKPGKNSLAGILWSKTPGNEPVQDSQTYSEMWMGTYPTNPSYLLSTGEPLADYIKKNPELIGKYTLDKFGPEIPYLPKILSFAKALPLQIHPDKELAQKLHQQDPKKFGDANHKPEIAVALSNFELFAGFKPVRTIEGLMRLKPLEQFIPQQDQKQDDEFLRQICKTFLKMEPETVSATIKELRTVPEANFGEDKYIPGILDRLCRQYSDKDPGNLVAAILMNYLTLGPGDAVCVPADSIHAYLSGDIIECMARSDNVINTGFCPRAQRDDVELFSQALTFKPHSRDAAVLPYQKSDKGTNGKTVTYAPPFSEFNVLATCLGPGETEIHKPVPGPSLMIVTKGSGNMRVPNQTIELKEGYVYFVGQGVALDFTTDKGMAIYRPCTE